MGIRRLKRPAIFLDRDGVLNDVVMRGTVPTPPQSVAELVVRAETRSAIDRLRNAGFELVVVTNQPDVARGTQRREVVEEINSTLGRLLAIDDFRVCYHDDADDCDCRKPRAGLLMAAATEKGLDLGRSVMIGDRWRDIDAGANAGCRCILIESAYAGQGEHVPDAKVRSLCEAVDWILTRPIETHP